MQSASGDAGRGVIDQDMPGPCYKCGVQPWYRGHKCKGADSSPAPQQWFYAVQQCYTPGVYKSWNVVRPQVEPPLCTYKPFHKKFPDLDSAIEFMGGGNMHRAWEAFSDDRLDDEEERGVVLFLYCNFDKVRIHRKLHFKKLIRGPYKLVWGPCSKNSSGK